MTEERRLSFEKPRYRCCIKLGLGVIEQAVDPVTGEPLFEPKRFRKSKPKPKLVYNGLVFHALRRTFITDAEHAGAPRHEAMMLSAHRSEAVYRRYAIGNRERRRAVVEQIAEYRSEKFKHNSSTIERSAASETSISQ